MNSSWKIIKLGNIADIKRGLASHQLNYVGMQKVVEILI